jgi:broad specificity phosphatase PhoE
VYSAPMRTGISRFVLELLRNFPENRWCKMNKPLPKIYIVRHGETEWSITNRHTGKTDLPLTPHGEEEAARLRKRLEAIHPVQVLSSPLQRARRTCELAGWGEKMQIDPDLSEWDYGDYDGRTTPEIRQERPGWSLFRDGCPNGETAEEVGVRADRIIAHLRARGGDALLFGHSHMFRILAARWLTLPAQSGAYFKLSPASVSILSFEHTAAEPVIALWNDERPA